MKGNDSFFAGYNSAGSKDVKVVLSVLTSKEHSVSETSIPNSVTIKEDKNGNKISERYYDNDGKAYLDIDYTNHGNPARHPVVPHQHKISWEDGKMNRGKDKEILK